MNIALKVAIVLSKQTARRISLRARVPEQRLSDIVQNRVVATEKERAALAKVLGVDVATIFPAQAA